MGDGSRGKNFHSNSSINLKHLKQKKMKTKTILYGTITGTISMFLLGFLIFGVALAGFMAENANPAINRPAEQMNFPALVVSNCMWALLISIMIVRSNAKTVSAGAQTGALIGFLGCLGFDLTMFATTSLYAGGMTVIIVDVLAFTVLTTGSGALIGWVTGRTASSAATATT